MLPWIVLTIMLCIGLVISVIYTTVDFLIKEYYFTGVMVLIIGLLCVCKLLKTYNDKITLLTHIIFLRRLLVHVVGDLQLLSKNQGRRQPNSVHENTILWMKTTTLVYFLMTNVCTNTTTPCNCPYK